MKEEHVARQKKGKRRIFMGIMKDFWDLHPDLTFVELLEYLKEKTLEVPRIDTEENLMEFAMRVEVYGQGAVPGDTDYDRDIALDRPLKESDPCYRCGKRTQREVYESDCAKDCK